jgi:transcriptional regulator with XRE-family HTH domain
MTTKSKTMGEVLAEARIKAGLTQLDLGLKLGYSGSQIVSNWERNLCGIPVKKAAVFCKLTSMKPSEMEKLLVSAAATKLGNSFR